jgi:hypothetical protein
MSDQVNHPETPKPTDSKPAETSTEGGLDRIADEAASRAIKTEERYDQNHDIFSK